MALEKNATPELPEPTAARSPDTFPGDAAPLAGPAAPPVPTPGAVATTLVAGAEYMPARTVDNDYFSRLTGKPPEWFERAAGITARHRAGAEENANTMAVSAVRRLLEADAAALEGVDLVIGASYTPWDTLNTIAHAVQRQFDLRGARAIYLSTGCSSFINALELVAAYVESGRSRRALVVASEHNSLYARDDDPMAGHLWGDGAAAVVLSAGAAGPGLRVLDIATRGLAELGLGPEALSLVLPGEGLAMGNGKDVFRHACREMEEGVREMLARHRLSFEQIRLLVPHQANQRIIDQLARQLEAKPGQVASVIGRLGNTGGASTAIALLRHRQLLRPGELALLVTFGGGYSMGSALLRAEGA